MDLGWPDREAEAGFADKLDDATALILVADAGADAGVDGVVGHLSGRIGEPSSIRPIRIATLVSLYVGPAYRSSGVGADLVDRFLAWAKQRGADRAAVSAYATNDGAIRFYERHGFAPHTVVLEQPL